MVLTVKTSSRMILGTMARTTCSITVRSDLDQSACVPLSQSSSGLVSLDLT